MLTSLRLGLDVTTFHGILEEGSNFDAGGKLGFLDSALGLNYYPSNLYKTGKPTHSQKKNLYQGSGRGGVQTRMIVTVRVEGSRKYLPGATRFKTKTQWYCTSASTGISAS